MTGLPENRAARSRHAALTGFGCDVWGALSWRLSSLGGRILKIHAIFSWNKAIGPNFAVHSFMGCCIAAFRLWKSERLGACLLNPDGSIFVYTLRGGLRMIRR